MEDGLWVMYEDNAQLMFVYLNSSLQNNCNKKCPQTGIKIFMPTANPPRRTVF